jgi:peptidoglycan-associated lipoprotein
MICVVALLTLAGCTTTTKHYDWAEASSPARPAKPAQTVEPQQVALVEDFAVNAGDRIYFDTDKSVLRPDAKDTLDRQIEWLTRHPDVAVRLEGNADERGSDAYNYALGERRAQAARDYLVANGISATRITSVSYGKTQPIESGRSAESLARNRNVRVILGQ